MKPSTRNKIQFVVGASAGAGLIAASGEMPTLLLRAAVAALGGACFAAALSVIKVRDD